MQFLSSAQFEALLYKYNNAKFALREKEKKINFLCSVSYIRKERKYLIRQLLFYLCILLLEF